MANNALRVFIPNLISEINDINADLHYRQVDFDFVDFQSNYLELPTWYSEWRKEDREAELLGLKRRKFHLLSELHKLGYHHPEYHQPQNFIDLKQLRDFPVGEVISSYIKLSPNGKSHCPFHPDSTPSLSVDFRRNRWKCFSCRRSGSNLDFIMEKEECSLQEAINILKKIIK